MNDIIASQDIQIGRTYGVINTFAGSIVVRDVNGLIEDEILLLTDDEFTVVDNDDQGTYIEATLEHERLYGTLSMDGTVPVRDITPSSK